MSRTHCSIYDAPFNDELTFLKGVYDDQVNKPESFTPKSSRQSEKWTAHNALAPKSYLTVLKQFRLEFVTELLPHSPYFPHLTPSDCKQKNAPSEDIFIE